MMTLSTTQLRPSLTIDLTALAQNYRTLAAMRPDGEMACVVKADCYGLGVADIAPVLHEAGCRTFFVAYTFEGVALRDILGARPARICIFNGPGKDDVAACRAHDLTPVLNTLDQIDLWLDQGRNSAIIHVDTGMNRLGLTAGEVEHLLATDGYDALPVSHIISHFAFGSMPDAGENRQQATRFAGLIDRLSRVWPEARASLSASAGLFLPFRPTEALIRPGIALYGASPQDAPQGSLQTVATLEAPVLQLRTIQPGETCGYSGTFTATRPTRLATLAIGYADGYPRSLSNKGRVMINGCECPIVGNVSMDLIIADVTDCKTPPAVGERAECFGAHIPVEVHAQRAGTIAYEIFTMLGGRIERRWVR